MAPPENRYMIMGYDVMFPEGKRPFPAQFAVMSKVLTALKTEQHALLESPTGSGKTLALLCSTLTFQRQLGMDLVAARAQEAHDPIVKAQRAKKEAQEAQSKARATQRQLVEAHHQVAMARKARQQQAKLEVAWPLQATQVASPDDVVTTQERGNGGHWVSTRTRELETNRVGMARKRQLPPSFAVATLAAHGHPVSLAPRVASLKATNHSVPPRIIFCSRTHAQLTQVVDELKTCPEAYRTLPDGMATGTTHELQTCVLGSKRNLCVNPQYNGTPAHVDEKCRVALEHASCAYFRRRRHTNTLHHAVPPIWDIEELVHLARTHRECAYFHAREALATAHLVFAPYNYVLDPTTRTAVGLDVTNAIIVLDEGHNVDATCRDSASVEVTGDVLMASIQAFRLVLQDGTRPPAYAALVHVLEGLDRWLNEHDARGTTVPGHRPPQHVWNGTMALAILAEYAGLTQETMDVWHTRVDDVRAFEADVASGTSVASRRALGPVAVATVQRILDVVSFMLRDEGRYSTDFRLVVLPSVPVSPCLARHDVRLCLWCLNAAVVFADLTTRARSVIVTSGTLSPLASFAGELGQPFAIRLEATHVVQMARQVFVAAIRYGPGQVDLKATYRNQHDVRYQDALGQVVHDYAHVIPGGMLVFCPSYALLEDLARRWHTTKVWQAMERVKAIFVEPRHAGRAFDALVHAYKATIARCQATRTDDAQTGAILLAVYRGKVSEGIDFANANARAVLCVGIPFACTTDVRVALKRQYQEEKSRDGRDHVNGTEWYHLQAFRALNQALGRCIRHCHDYGALVLLDSRHCGPKHRHDLLAKWLRPSIRELDHAHACVPLFRDFFQRNERALPQPVPLRLNDTTRVPQKARVEQDDTDTTGTTDDTSPGTPNVHGRVFAIFRQNA